MAGAPPRDRPHACGHPDLDRLDPAVQHRRERSRGTHDAEAGVAGIGRDAGERAAQSFVRGLASDALRKRDERTCLARRSPARPEARDVLRRAADEDDREFGPPLDRSAQEVGHEADAAPLVGPDRRARGDHHAAHVRRRAAAVIIWSGSSRSRLSDVVRQPEPVRAASTWVRRRSLAASTTSFRVGKRARDDARPVGGRPERAGWARQRGPAGRRTRRARRDPAPIGRSRAPRPAAGRRARSARAGGRRSGRARHPTGTRWSRGAASGRRVGRRARPTSSRSRGRSQRRREGSGSPPRHANGRRLGRPAAAFAARPSRAMRPRWSLRPVPRGARSTARCRRRRP